MPSNKPIFTLRTEDMYLKKLKEIAKLERRSDNKQLEKILIDYIEEYERKHGEIFWGGVQQND